MGSPLAALAQAQEDTTDWLGNPLRTEQPEDIGVQPDDSVDPFEGRPLPTAIQEKGQAEVRSFGVGSSSDDPLA